MISHTENVRLLEVFVCIVIIHTYTYVVWVCLQGVVTNQAVFKLRHRKSRNAKYNLWAFNITTFLQKY